MQRYLDFSSRDCLNRNGFYLPIGVSLERINFFSPETIKSQGNPKEARHPFNPHE